MNLYSVLNVSSSAKILEICKAFQNKCLNNPANVFNYTKALAITINKNKRIIHDATYFGINLNILLAKEDIYDEILELTEEEEYELANFIDWLNDFRDLVYDTKYQIMDYNYHQLLEKWFNKIESISEELKSHIHNFYLT